MNKRFISLLLALLMAFSIIPVSAVQSYAAQTDGSAVGAGDELDPEDDPEDVTEETTGNIIEETTEEIIEETTEETTEEETEYDPYANLPEVHIGNDLYVSFIYDGEESETEKTYVICPETDIHCRLYSDSRVKVEVTLYDSENRVMSPLPNQYGYRFYAEYELEAEKKYYLVLRLNDTLSSDNPDIFYALSTRVMPRPESLKIINDVPDGGYTKYAFYIQTQLYPTDAYEEEITYTSSDESIATVDKWGYVLPVAPGTAVITATSASGLSDTFTVNVPSEETLTEGEYTPVLLTSDNDFRLAFTAPKTCWYEFNIWGNYQISCNPLNFSYESMEYESKTITMICSMTEGETYYFSARILQNGQSDYCYAQIEELPDATLLEIDGSETLTKYVTEEFTLTTKFFPVYCQPENITFSTNNEDVLEVSNDGTVKCLSAGTAKVTATADNEELTDSVIITVKDLEPLTLNNNTLVKTTAECRNVLLEFTPTSTGFYDITSDACFSRPKAKLGHYENGSVDYSLGEIPSTSKFSYGAPYILNGRYKLTAGEKYIISAGYAGGSVNGSYNIMVSKASVVEAIYFMQGTEVYCTTDNSVTFTVGFSPSGTSEALRWESSDASTVSINSSGVAQMIKAGEATITATTASGISKTILVHVTDYKELSADESVNVRIFSSGYTERFKFVPDQTCEYSFTSSFLIGSATCELFDENMDSIAQSSSGTNNKFGITEILEAGKTYYLTTKYPNGSSGSFTLYVKKNTDALSIAFAQGSNIEGRPCEEIILKVVSRPAGMDIGELSWSSSDNNIATVSRGVVKFVAPGTAVITAKTSNGAQAECTVTVLDYESLSLEEVKQVDLSAGEYAIYKFIPPQTADYYFYSTCEKPNTGIICDADMNILNQNNGIGNGFSFNVCENLIKGETYYLKAAFESSSESGSFSVSITDDNLAKSLSISTKNNFAFAGTKDSVIKTFYPTGALTEEVSYSSSNEDVAEFDEYGFLYYRSAGTAVITVVSERGLTATLNITVKDTQLIQPGETATVTIDEPGDYVVFKLKPDNNNNNDYYSFFSEGSGNYRCYQFESTGSGLYNRGFNIGKVDLNIQLSRYSTYYYVCKFNDENATGLYNVSLIKTPEIEQIVFDCGDSIEAMPGEVYEPRISFLPEHTRMVSYSFSSQNPEIASVDYDDIIHFNRPGTTVITASTYTGITSELNVTVKDYEEIKAGEKKSVQLQNRKERHIYRFIPEKDGSYSFGVLNGNYVSLGIFDSEMNYIEDVVYNDSGEISTVFEGGKTYFISANYFGVALISYDIVAHASEYMTGMEIISYPERMTYVEGYVKDHLDLDGLKVRTVWSDGEVIDWEYYDDSDLRGFYMYVDVDYNQNLVMLDCETQSVTFNLNVIENPIESLEVVHGVDYTLTENIDGKYYFKYNPETGCNDIPYFYYSRHDFNMVEIKANLKDSTSRILRVGDGIYGYGFQIRYNQSSEDPWRAGGDNNNVIFSMLGFEANVNIPIEENPIDHIELKGYQAPQLHENTEGSYKRIYNNNTHQYEEYFNYDYSKYIHAVFDVYFKDGTVETHRIGDYILNNKITVFDNQDNKHFTPGRGNVVYLNCCGYLLELPVTVGENQVESIKLVSNPTRQLLQNVDGTFSREYDPDTDSVVNRFNYNLDLLNDAVIQINYKDGTSQNANALSYVDNIKVTISANQKYRPFTIGNNPVTISYLGFSVTAYATVIANPVKSIEVMNDFKLEHYKENNGYRNYYIDESGNHTSYFHYEYNEISSAKIRINYNDGTYRYAHPYDYVDGNYVKVVDTQFTDHWLPDKDNHITISYLEKEVEVPVIIHPNKVESIELVKESEHTYIENTDGRMVQSVNTETGEVIGNKYFYYDVYSSYFSDAVIKINYYDGTSKTANVGDIVDGYGIYIQSAQHEKHWSLGSDNTISIEYMGKKTSMNVTVVETPVESIVIDNAPEREYIYGDIYFGGANFFKPTDFTGLQFTVNYKDGTQKTFTENDIIDSQIEGRPFDVLCDRTESVGEMTVTLSYLGSHADYVINVTESEIERIKFIDRPYNHIFPGYSSVDWRGTTLSVEYSNHGTSSITLDESNIIYDKDNAENSRVGFVIDGIMGELTCEFREGKWAVATAKYTDKTAQAYITAFFEPKTVTSVQAENINDDLEDTILHISYEDGSKGTLTIDGIAYVADDPDSKFKVARAYIDNSLIDIKIAKPEFRDELGYDINVFGQDVDNDKEYLSGDVNGDGEVDVNDASLVNRFSAQYKIGSSDYLTSCGDIDGDGIISVSDATWVQRYIAGMDIPYEIGKNINEFF